MLSGLIIGLITSMADRLEATFRCGKRLVTVSLPRPAPGALLLPLVEWTPSMPRKLSGSERRTFRREFAAALDDMRGELEAAAVEQQVVLDPDPCELALASIH